MGTAWLHWLDPVFEEAQVVHTEATAPVLDAALRRLVGAEATTPDEVVWRRLCDTWLVHGPPGIQLLGGLLRGQVLSRRDSPLRPREGQGYFTGEDP
ncbi:MAG: hypothetical protein JXB39_11170 [Deltaproteobacteria bacterium]|nr:hypothetical protein [Deltaproteobacteria bacterium]